MFKLAILAPIVFLGFSSAVVADSVRSNVDKVQGEQVSSSTKGNKKSSKGKSGSSTATSGKRGDGKGECGIQMAASYP